MLTSFLPGLNIISRHTGLSKRAGKALTCPPISANRDCIEINGHSLKREEEVNIIKHVNNSYDPEYLVKLVVKWPNYRILLNIATIPEMHSYSQVNSLRSNCYVK